MEITELKEMPNALVIDRSNDEPNGSILIQFKLRCNEKDDTSSFVVETALHKTYQLFPYVMVLDVDKIWINKVGWKFWKLSYSVCINLGRNYDTRVLRM